LEQEKSTLGDFNRLLSLLLEVGLYGGEKLPVKVLYAFFVDLLSLIECDQAVEDNEEVTLHIEINLRGHYSSEKHFHEALDGLGGQALRALTRHDWDVPTDVVADIDGNRHLHLSYTDFFNLSHKLTNIWVGLIIE
jgi:hypothetical protein